ncbi:zinc knuckle CX2CX4HX4C containing protein [Tanacetum coccineum]
MTGNGDMNKREGTAGRGTSTKQTRFSRRLRGELVLEASSYVVDDNGTMKTTVDSLDGESSIGVKEDGYNDVGLDINVNVRTTSLFEVTEGGVDIFALFGVPFKSITDFDNLTKRIEAGEYADVMTGLTSDEHKAIMDELEALWKKICVAMSDNNSNNGMEAHVPCHDSLNMKTPHINKMLVSYARAAGLQSSVSNEAGAAAEPSLEDVLENGPWMIRNSPIILKKWSMNTRLCKEELTRTPVWVKIHDVPLQVFSEDGISIIASQIESLTMGVPLIEDEDSGFSIETMGAANVVNTSKSGSSHVSSTSKNQSNKAIVPPASSRRSPGVDKGGIIMSSSYAALDAESEEEVKNVFDESVNL